MQKPLLVDGHQDLAYNILTFGRDYTRPVEQTRRLEKNTQTPQQNGDTLLGWPEYQHGRVAIVFATLFAAPNRRKLGDWDTQSYADTGEAFQLYNAQLDAYYALAENTPQKFRLLQTRDSLESHLAEWEKIFSEEITEIPVGMVILMENAEAVRHPDELVEWWARGVRIIGPAWSGTRYCGGTHEPGPLTRDGYLLLDSMAECGYILDLSHMDEEAVVQALDYFPGRIIASHSNTSALLKNANTNRHLSDRMISGILERNGVIGVVPANSFLLPGWKDLGGRAAVSLDLIIAQIDYICQLAGDALHVAIGSDFDGGFGVQAVPADLDTIADLQKLVPLLQDKGYQDSDIIAIFNGNWIRLLLESLP